MTKILDTAFKTVKFTDCKLMGLRFEECNDFLFSVSFSNCQLNFSSFFKLKLKKIHFKNCMLQEVDFAQTDLSNSTFTDCDLSGALFSRSNLEKSDFRTSFNYSIDPVQNRLKKTLFSREGVVGLLDRFNIIIE
jgi:uncharacterized protein YjbI with pentapeptide repeats